MTRAAPTALLLLVLAASTPASGIARVVPPGIGAQARIARDASIRALIAFGRPVYCGGPRGNEIALTFDDGPGPYTARAIHILRRAHDRASFFVVGRNIAGRRALVRDDARLGDVGDHTWNHRFLPALSIDTAEAEVSATAHTLADVLRRPVRFFRPPYGALTPQLETLIRHLRMLTVLWSVDSRDSEGADAAQIADNVLSGARPGAIILMHENRGQTLKAMRWDHLLTALRARHLRAVTLTKLLTTDPPSAAQRVDGLAGCQGARDGLRGG